MELPPSCTGWRQTNKIREKIQLLFRYFSFFRSCLHAKNLLWLNCHSRFFYKLKNAEAMGFCILQAVEKVRQPPEGHQTHHPRDARGMLFGFPQYPFPAKKQPILRTAHTKSAVFSVKVSGFPVHARESRRYFHCPIFSKRFIDKLKNAEAMGFCILFLQCAV